MACVAEARRRMLKHLGQIAFAPQQFSDLVLTVSIEWGSFLRVSL